jgi:hypothetical protein
LDADPDESPGKSYVALRAIYTRDDFNAAQSSHKTFVESEDLMATEVLGRWGKKRKKDYPRARP